MQPSPTELAKLAQLAQSPAGQALLQLLQQRDGAALNTAMEKAAAGDYSQAQKALTGLLSSPEAQQLLRRLEESL